MKTFFVLIMKEWKPFFKESRYWVPFFIPPSLFLISVVFQAKIEPSLLNRFAVFIGAMALSMGADRISMEREKKMLEVYAMLPISRQVLFWSKSIAVILVPILIWIFAMFVFVLVYGNYIVSMALSATLWLMWTLLGLMFILWTFKSAKMASQSAILFFLLSVFGQELAMATGLPIGGLGAMFFIIALIWYSNRRNWWICKH